MIDSPDQQLQRLVHGLLRETKVLFAEVARYCDGTIAHATLKRNLTPVRRGVEALLLRGYGTAAHGMCNELYTHRHHLWTFLSDPQVEPTNNAGERSLRCSAATALGLAPPSSVGGLGCFWRKLSFGTHSERGDRFV
ncbi:MAG: transposase [Planctomycetaceae bacterium]